MKDIFENYFTISNKFRKDIEFFFKDKNFNIVEVGSFQGWTTYHLANIFNNVYGIDNNDICISNSIKNNKNKTNVEIFKFDIYKDDWEELSFEKEKIDVVFIDASHEYKDVKRDVENCIKTFTNLKYIILDDYGVWPGVKQLVHEFQDKNIINIEKFMGLTDIPAPIWCPVEVEDIKGKIGFVKNSNEGVLVSINKKYNIK